MTETIKHYSRKSKIRHLIILAILTIFCIVAYNLFIRTGSYNIDGDYIYYKPEIALTNSLLGFLISFPILAFIIGLLVSLIPYRNLTYAKKYLRSSILSLIVIDSLFAIALIIIIGMTIAGIYPPEVSEQTFIQNKKQGTNEYKTTMSPLIDSSIFYLDKMILKLEHTHDTTNIFNDTNLNNDRNSFNNFQTQMMNKSEEFKSFAEEYNLTMEEYMQVLSYWDSQSIELLNKGKQLDSLINANKNAP